ncbi:hypothetical protein BKA63DRAFT_451809 [Paraphoma chrysanthemicola]|nr:hypothetical protein BKA63DRAFT_451809 [Paraphoma chrysanthemicola]
MADQGAVAETTVPPTEDEPTPPRRHTTIDLSPYLRTNKRIPQYPTGEDMYRRTGDCYHRNQETADHWHIVDSESLPYLTRVKALSTSYRSLQYLADWMEVGTAPFRWDELDKSKRNSRVNRTEISVFEEKPGRLDLFNFSRADEFEPFLCTRAIDAASSIAPTQQTLRLFILEDLSRTSIELLGSRFNIDPHFFREQLTNFVWYNTRDPWAKAPQVFAAKRRRCWYRLRNVRLRYHESDKSFQEANKEANSFNVLRRPNSDGNTWSYHDTKDSVVSITSTRTSVWIGKDKQCHDSPVGIVLVDPTTRDGRPLWFDRANWVPVPELDSTSNLPSSTCDGIWYDDIVRMSFEYPWFEISPSNDVLDLGRIVLPTLNTVSAEWYIVCSYVKSRLGQIEWELETPSPFKARGRSVDTALRKIATWRRQIPTWREMVQETLDDALPTAIRLTTQDGFQSNLEGFQDAKVDYERILRTLEELQTRVDHLSDRGNAEMQLAAAHEQYEAAQKGLEESHNLARLTWLATIFIPMTFVSGLFSMTDNVGTITGTFKTYFAVAIPLAVVSLATARFGSTLTRWATILFTVYMSAPFRVAQAHKSTLRLLPASGRRQRRRFANTSKH